MQPCSGADTFYAIIDSPVVAEICKKVEELKTKALLSGSEEEYRQYHDEGNAVKKLLPGFIFQAVPPGPRRLQKEAVLNGLCMVDYDGIDNPRDVIDGWFRAHGGKTKFVTRNQIFLIHITPSGHGIRIVMVADASVGNLADNQARLDTVVGLRHDESCKDSSRISYAFPRKNLVFLNEELFTFSNPEYDRRYGDEYRGGSSAPVRRPVPPVHPGSQSGCTLPFPTEKPQQKLLPKPAKPAREGAGETASSGGASGAASGAAAPSDGESDPTKYQGVLYADIIAKWWELHGGVPRTGERNDKLLKLAASLRYICDQREESIMAVIPRLGLSEAEVESIVKNACHYAVYQTMPKPMRIVLDALGIERSTYDYEANGSSRMSIQKSSKLLQEQFSPRFEALQLPPVFQAIAAGVPDNLRIGAVVASLPMLYTLATGITFRHFDGALSRLSGMTFVVGPAASGKSFILDLDELLMRPLREADKVGRLMEEEYKRKKEREKNKQNQSEKPHVCIRNIPIQVSNTCLGSRLRFAKAEPDNPDDNWFYHLYHIETELATVVRAQKGGSWIEKNDIYCKAFHNERWGMDYANDQAINGEVQVNLNMVVSGTEDSFDALVTKSNLLGGLPTRLMYYPMPYEPFKMIPERRMRTDSQRQLLTDIAMKLDTLKAEREVEARPLTDKLYEWCAEKALLAEVMEDYELDDLRKRTALIGERAGVIFAILEHLDGFLSGEPLEISSSAIDFACFVADFALQAQYIKFATSMRERKEHLSLAAGTKRCIVNWVEIFNNLPFQFTNQLIIQTYPDLSPDQVRVQVSRWKDKKYVTPLDRGLFEKLKEKIERAARPGEAPPPSVGENALPSVGGKVLPSVGGNALPSVGEVPLPSLPSAK